ncbi:recombination-associated protein RdgC [Nissabacter sp. SGAir0207]|uniref:recombination-associated protein RdgC n=1 Tax=Nissabacter sp. SGAir0207 TaxID=2126321 RepID=UPI0010CD07E9|nr:recombination-associated protein RdgC [Nissabacter sp. SGAir0207]QCR38747.1 recombination-associated protein RdgC [Nissabacter sp. SGAir0207]
MFKEFRTASIYQLGRDVGLSQDEMQQQLDAFRFTPCASQDMARSGFISPLTFSPDDELVQAGNGFLLVAIKHEKKMLPGAVVKTALASRVETLEVEQNRRLKKSEKESLKDEVIHSLLPRAFSGYSQTLVLFDIQNMRVFVNAPAKKAEDALALIRKALGSLPVVPLTMESPIELTLTEWVKTASAPAGWTLGERAELQALLADGGAAKVTKQDLASDEIQAMIDAGKLVTRLELNWQDRVWLVVSDSGALSGLSFADELIGQNDDIDREEAHQRRAADIELVADELFQVTNQLTEALGGVAQR